MTSRNPWHGLLFLQGHIADPDLARALSAGRGAAPGTPPRGASLLGHGRDLGGRTMHAGHNFDAEEPLVEVAPSEAPQGVPARAMAPGTRGADRARPPLAC